MIPIQTIFSNTMQHTTKTKGSYILFISLAQNSSIEIGSLGDIYFQKGYYLYIGSALGPGGLIRRVERHLRKEKKIFWHIDYLLDSPFSKIIAVTWKEEKQKLECQISKDIDNLASVYPVSNFGSSDCNCISHLKYVKVNNITDFYKEILTTVAPYEMLFEEVLSKISIK